MFENAFVSQLNSLRTPAELLNIIMQTLRSVPDPERSKFLINRTFDHIAKIVTLIQSQTSIRTSSVSLDQDFQLREDAAYLLAILDACSRSLALSVESWRQSKYDGATGKDVTGLTRIQMLNADLERTISDFVSPQNADSNFEQRNIQTKGVVSAVKELNELRELHKTAMDELQAARKELDFYKRSSDAGGYSPFQNNGGNDGKPQSGRSMSSSYLLSPDDRFSALPRSRKRSSDSSLSSNPDYDSPTFTSRKLDEGKMGLVWDELRRLESLVDTLQLESRDRTGRGENNLSKLQDAVKRLMQIKINNVTEFSELKKASASDEASVRKKHEDDSNRQPSPPPVLSVPLPPTQGGPPPPAPPAPPVPTLPGAPVPPPPPPPGISSAPHAKPIEILKSTVPMRQLQWSKLKNDVVASSVWNEISSEAYESPAVLEEDDLVNLFTKAKGPVKLPESSSATDLQKRKIHLINPTRARNMEIMLRGLRLKSEKICKALLTMDSSTVSVDMLGQIHLWLPKPEEQDLLRSYDGNLDSLGNAEKYIHNLLNIPRLKTRIDAMIFYRRFNGEIQEIIPDLKTALIACSQIRTSPKLKKLLQSVLVIGNYLNGTSFRGDARGFKLESLLALKDTRAAPGNDLNISTLLHYFAFYLETKASDTLDFMDEMTDVEATSRISISSLQDSVKLLRAGYKSVSDEIRLYTQAGYPKDPKDRFVQEMELFEKEALKPLEEAETLSQTLEKTLMELFDHFGEDKKERMKHPERFFDLLPKFAQSLQVNH